MQDTKIVEEESCHVSAELDSDRESTIIYSESHNADSIANRAAGPQVSKSLRRKANNMNKI